LLVESLSGERRWRQVLIATYAGEAEDARRASACRRYRTLAGASDRIVSVHVTSSN
jgi:hypothetical protein